MVSVGGGDLLVASVSRKRAEPVLFVTKNNRNYADNSSGNNVYAWLISGMPKGSKLGEQVHCIAVMPASDATSGSNGGETCASPICRTAVQPEQYSSSRTSSPHPAHPSSALLQYSTSVSSAVYALA